MLHARTSLPTRRALVGAVSPVLIDQPVRVWQQGDIRDPGGVISINCRWGYDVRTNRFYPGNAMVAVRPAAAEMIPGHSEWVDYLHRPFEVYWDEGGQELPIFKGRVKAVNAMSPTDKEGDINRGVEAD